uniref:Uncharacterized protein n=2 Tax=Oryzias latipes TaxID=8090 RepID=A0A3P9H8K9_ORYLA
QNIPIWSMTCDPCFFKPSTSCSLIVMMRLAIESTSFILAPFTSTLFASSASLQTTVKPPTRSPSPMFLAKDCDRTMLCPCSMKYRTAQASRSMSPLAKPW